jgi:hypothetical protein
MLPVGKFKATVLEHHISTTSKGDPQAVVKFEVDHQGSKVDITWYGYFTPKTEASTIKGLIACGLEGNNPAGPLQIGKQVLITVEHEMDKEGNMRAKVRWVNPIGAPKNVMSQELAKVKLAQLEGAVLAARQGSSSDEIPF